jgi:ketosteroid isomerase-like protein
MSLGSMGAAAVSIVAIVRAMEDEFVRRVRARDVDGLVGFYYEEDARVLPPNCAGIQGKARIREFFRGFLAGGVTDLSLETIEVHSSGDLAYEVGRYAMTLGGSSMDPIDDRGKYVVIFRRQTDGSWKAAVDMFSSDRGS